MEPLQCQGEVNVIAHSASADQGLLIHPATIHFLLHPPLLILYFSASAEYISQAH